MIVGCWLIVNSRGKCRVTKRRPCVEADEVALKLELDLPKALFQRPHLEARISVPDAAAVGEVIDTVIKDNVKEAVERATGLKFSIGVVVDD